MHVRLPFMLIFGITMGCGHVWALPQYTQVCQNDMCEPISFYDKNQVLKALPKMWLGTTPRLTFCQADPATRRCIKDGLEIHGHSALMQVHFRIPFARILWAPQECRQTFSMNLDYQIQANDFYPVSTMSPGIWTIGQKGLIQFNSPDFTLHTTDLGNSQFAAHYTIDFVDFTQKTMGAYYTIISTGDVIGQTQGYAIIQMSETGRFENERPNPTGISSNHAPQTPLMQSDHGRLRMPNLLDIKQPALTKQQILHNQAQWNVKPALEGLYDTTSGQWYANDEGAFAHVPLNQQTMHYKWGKFLEKTSNLWNKFLHIIYLEPES